MTSLRKAVQRLMAGIGYQVNKRDAMHSGRVRRILLLKHFGIDTIIDVGANEGQYARQLRLDGFTGRIVSFEPLSDAFEVLSDYTDKDNTWEAYMYALGHRNERATINVAANPEWSSLLSISPEFADAPAGANMVHKQEVEVRRLDAIFDELSLPGSRQFLKVDAQGYEKNILEGASGCLRAIVGIQLEMSLQRAYADEVLFPEMLGLMEDLGFVLMSLDPINVNNNTGRIRQVDGLFFRRDEGDLL